MPEEFCVDCGQALKGRYMADGTGRKFCKDCGGKRVVKCEVCKQIIKGECMAVADKKFHSACFVCSDCGNSLKDGVKVKSDGRYLCKVCAASDKKKKEADQVGGADANGMPAKPDLNSEGVTSGFLCCACS